MSWSPELKVTCLLTTIIDVMASRSTPKIVELPPDGHESIRTSSRSTSKRTKIANGVKSQSATSPSWTRFILKWTVVTLLTAFGAAQFIAGDLLWGYRGKYTKVETYMPVSDFRGDRKRKSFDMNTTCSHLRRYSHRRNCGSSMALMRANLYM
jgi:hypothetical protein